jgi:protein-tyrosine phosphatase
MIDTHCHILPGMDDGAKELHESISMAEEAYKQGLEAIWATPHYIPGETSPAKENILTKTAELNMALKKYGLPVKVIPAEEILLTNELPVLFEQDVLLTINNCKKFLLIELPFGEAPIYTEKTLFELMVKGVTPIIAHPERSFSIQKNPAWAKKLVSSGVFLQLNAGSLLGYFGSKVQSTAKALLKEGIVHLLGSDAHSPHGRRAMSYKQAADLICRDYGLGYAELITKNNPNRILRGLDIETKIYKVKKISYLGGVFSFFKKAQ